MLVSERYAKILHELEQRSTVSIKSLTALMGVSRETIRKDLEQLAQDGKLEQVRGGATQIRTQEVPMSRRFQINSDGKSRIASFLARRIPSGSSLILDNGSTVLALAQALSSHKDLIVYTNDLKVAEAIAPATRELVIIGGRIDPAEMATFGAEALENISRYRADYAVVSAGGLSSSAFLTDFTREGSNLRQHMISQSQKAFILADSTKFGAIGHVVTPQLPKGSSIVCDVSPDPEILQLVSEKKIDLLVAD